MTGSVTGCMHGKTWQEECIPCALEDEKRAYDEAKEQLELRSKRLRALRARAANLPSEVR